MDQVRDAVLGKRAKESPSALLQNQTFTRLHFPSLIIDIHDVSCTVVHRIDECYRYRDRKAEYVATLVERAMPHLECHS